MQLLRFAVRSVLIVSGFVGLTLVGCRTQTHPLGVGAKKLDPVQLPAPKTDYATIAHANRITVYEGLPHQHAEKELYARELKSKSTLELHGYPFYRETLGVSKADAESIGRVLGDVKTYCFGTPGSAKGCHYHPDYAVEWIVGGSVCQSLICLGCAEVIVYGPQGRQGLDFEKEPHKVLQALFAGYRKNRPPIEPDPL
jgi:hypothetical protein